MKKIIIVVINIVASLANGKYAGKLIGLFDFCRNYICKNKKTFAGQIHYRMDLRNIIPHNKIEKQESKVIERTDRIKVRIIYPAGCAWNHIHSLYIAFKNDNRFQTYVIVRDNQEFLTILERYNCQYVTYSNYSLKNDKPDILIATFYSSYDNEIIFNGCSQYVGKIFAEIPNVVMNEKNDDIHWEYISRAYKYLQPDYWILDPLVYKK